MGDFNFGGSDTWFGGGGIYKGDDGSYYNDELFGDSKINSSDYLASPSILNNNDTGAGPAWNTSISGSDIGASNTPNYSTDSGSIFGLGGGDGKTFGMDTGKFALGAAQTGLGFLNYFNTKEYNDVQMDAMKQNMALTQEQYDDYKTFKSDTAARYA